LLPAFGWKRRQFKYVNRLWEKESSWNVSAQNPGSGAYGIPQAVPGSKMATAGTDWQTSARTQILWGLGYIRAAYGSPRQAWLHWVADGWY
jgi:resuscitation-promoting factor RpfB